jgi:hypothetical protein
MPLTAETARWIPDADTETCAAAKQLVAARVPTMSRDAFRLIEYVFDPATPIGRVTAKDFAATIGRKASTIGSTFFRAASASHGATHGVNVKAIVALASFVRLAALLEHRALSFSDATMALGFSSAQSARRSVSVALGVDGTTFRCVFTGAAMLDHLLLLLHANAPTLARVRFLPSRAAAPLSLSLRRAVMTCEACGHRMHGDIPALDVRPAATALTLHSRSQEPLNAASRGDTRLAPDVLAGGDVRRRQSKRRVAARR